MHDTGYFKRLGITSENMAFQHLSGTFKKSIVGWDFFVNWGGVRKAVDRHRRSLNLLNSLIGLPEDKINGEFIDISKKYKETRSALPLLVATRATKLAESPVVLRNGKETNISYLFNPDVPLSLEVETQLLEFFIDSGVKAIITNREVKNLVDYCLGVEVGMDTNGRKNRTGTLMERTVEKELLRFCDKHKLQFISQANDSRILSELGFKISVDKSNRRFDFAIKTTSGKLVCIETNFYGSGGSKLKATAGEYRALHRFLQQQGVTLVWVTDGWGWQSSLLPLEAAFKEVDYIANLSMLRTSYLGDLMTVLS